MRKLYGIHISVPIIKFYWHTATSIRLHIMYGYFCYSHSAGELRQRPHAHKAQSFHCLAHCSLWSLTRKLASISTTHTDPSMEPMLRTRCSECCFNYIHTGQT